MNLLECNKCENFSKKYSSSAIIHTRLKPSIDYNISFWQPNKVKILFIAESPPFHSTKINKINDSYFYNPNESQRVFGAQSPLIGTLSWNLFWLLDINNNLSKEKKLQQFKGLGCYLVDAIKCRAQRYNRKNIINKTIKNCSLFLSKEISELNPNMIVVMGERSLYAIKNCFSFLEEDNKKNLQILSEETQHQTMIIEGHHFLFTQLPLWRNLGHLDGILKTFKQIKKSL